MDGCAGGVATHRRAGVARRTVVALALGGGFALAGCEADPGVAAYVGAETITEADVDRYVGDATTKAAGKQGLSAPSRSDVVITYVLGKLCSQRQAREGFTGQPVSPDQIQQIDSVPKDSDYAEMRSATYTCLSGLPNPGQAQPTEEDLQDIYDRAQAKGLVQVPLAEIRNQLADDASVRQAIAVKRMVADLVKGADVRVNPRYRPMEFRVSDLGSGEPLVIAVVGDPGSDVVRDIAAPVGSADIAAPVGSADIAAPVGSADIAAPVGSADGA
jgi:hypothetical protein